METETANIINVYKDVALTPTVSSAVLQILPDKNLVKIDSSWSVADLVKGESTKFTQEFLLQRDSQKCSLLSKGVPQESSASLSAFTKSRERIAIYRKSKKDNESAFLEIWNLSQKEKTFDVKEFKEHGSIHDSGEFKAFEWSANGKYLLYVAEAKQKKAESYFKNLFCDMTGQKESEEKIEQKASAETVKGEENLYRETWGESHTFAHHSVLCILDVEAGRVEVLDLEEKFPGTSIAQAIWGPKDEYIVFVGFKETPSRLGIIYCRNRTSSIYSYNIETKDVVPLTSDENISVQYPVFSPNFDCFVFLQNKSGGPHMSCRMLMKCDWKSKQISTVIDIVDDTDDFSGIYYLELSSRWWSDNSRFFFLHDTSRTFLEVFYVDIHTSKVRKIDVDKSYGECIIHDVKDPYILVSVSAPNLKPQLMIGYFTNLDDGIKVTWSLVVENSASILQDLSWSVYNLKPSLINECYPNLDYNILVVKSTEKNNGTLILFPHGGPHSAFDATFMVLVATFARLGYIVCMVNYRGSTGLGENNIKSLLGNIGSQDVSDVVQAAEYLKKDEKLGIKQVVGFGGSHGGFLIAHLLGQYPDFLKAAVIRNPVIDLTSMSDISDIPDWCWIESGCSKLYDPLETKNPPFLDEMWKKSPIRHVKNVKSPTLLCLGKNDLRVPHSQGLLFHRYLRAQDVPTKVYCYDDNHALSKVSVASDVFMQTALWFQTHLFS